MSALRPGASMGCGLMSNSATIETANVAASTRNAPPVLHATRIPPIAGPASRHAAGRTN